MMCSQVQDRSIHSFTSDELKHSQLKQLSLNFYVVIISSKRGVTYIHRHIDIQKAPPVASIIIVMVSKAS